MEHIHLLIVRDDLSSTLTPAMNQLLIALFVFVLIAVLLTGGLFLLRRARLSRKEEELPLYNEKPTSRRHNRHRLTIIAPPFNKRSESIYVVQEKQDLIANSSSPPSSPVPEIRITFPEEVDEFGKTQSGRVVVVRVGDHSVGMEPLDEKLPPYMQSESDRFQSLDLERIGGLKEKAYGRA